MKQILFRGKRKDNSEWVEGYYAKLKDYLSEEEIHCIFPLGVTLYPHIELENYYEVIPETVGRLIEGPCYDGIWDGTRKFFEGDVIAVYRKRDANISNDDYDYIAIVVDEASISSTGCGRSYPQDTVTTKVIGNVHDNPELVGKDKADLYLFYHGLNIDWT